MQIGNRLFCNETGLRKMYSVYFSTRSFTNLKAFHMSDAHLLKRDIKIPTPHMMCIISPI